MRARVVQSGTQSRDITDGHRGGVGGVGRIDAQLRVSVLDRVMRVEHTKQCIVVLNSLFKAWRLWSSAVQGTGHQCSVHVGHDNNKKHGSGKLGFKQFIEAAVGTITSRGNTRDAWSLWSWSRSDGTCDSERGQRRSEYKSV